MDFCTLGLPYLLTLSALFLVTVSMSAPCISQTFPNMVIDISQAVARGARFTDPLSVFSVEECLSACCMPLAMGGDPDCNLIVFDARKEPGLQNCYIFHCPTLDDCPLVPSPGVLSYSRWSEPSPPGDLDQGLQKLKPGDGSQAHSSRKTSGSTSHPTALAVSWPLDPNLQKPSAALVSQGSARHSAVKEPAASPRTPLLHPPDAAHHHLEKMESEDLFPTAFRPTTLHGEVRNVAPNAEAGPPGRAAYKGPQDLNISFPAATSVPGGIVPNRTKLSTTAPPSAPRAKAGLRVPPTASQDGGGASKVPSSDVHTAKLPGNAHGDRIGKPKNDRPLPHTQVPALRTPQTKQPQMATRPAPGQISPWTNGQLSTADRGRTSETPPRTQPEPAVPLEDAHNHADSARSGGALPSLEDRSGLVAALVFGMLFLIVVIGLVSRKVSEVRRRHRYTKLDYLINGMYVDT